MKSLLLVLPLAGCVDSIAGIEGTQSLRVDLIAPADTGSPDERLDDAARSVTVKVSAIDERNEIDTEFNGDVDVYAQFLGGLTPSLDDAPLERITLTNGVSQNTQFDLPPVFGATFLWIEDGTGDEATYATGTSPTLWFRDPYVSDVSTPEDETALDALEASPLEGKQIKVTGSRYGANGKLIVTGVYAQGYTVSDADCTTTPCVTGDYDHVLVFTFSAPKDENNNTIYLGEVIDGFGGAASEFNGLTEIGFPRTFVKDADHPELEHDPARLPPPVLFDTAWFGPLSNPAGRINFERNEAGAIEIRGAKVCDAANDPNYTTYKQWKIDPAGASGTCGSNTLSLITAGTDFNTDPVTLKDRILPRVVGILRPVNIGSFNVWIVYPRGSSDIDL